jgi:hypothetical protein
MCELTSLPLTPIFLGSGRVAGKLVVLLNEDKATAPPLGEVAAPA